MIRRKMEETQLREIGFEPIDEEGEWYVGATIVSGDIVPLYVHVPWDSFPYSEPKIYIGDNTFLGLHDCIIGTAYGPQIHFRNYAWNPSMHVAELVMNAVSFLKSLGWRYRIKKYGLWRFLK
jgi:hypothetical protein